MPFKSEAQRRWMHANEPEMAKRWEKHTPKSKRLPERVAKHKDYAPMENADNKDFIEKLDTIFAPTIGEKKNWIKDATKNKGGLHRSLGVPEGEKIPAKKIDAAAKKGGKVGKQAKLAKTLKKMH